jgi:oligopeptide transport system substrate-binding protein
MRWLPLLTALSLWVWSCTSKPPKGKYLRVALFSPYTSLDPLYARDIVSVWLTQQLFEGLLTYDDSLRLIPALAERYEVLEEGRRYRFYLRRAAYHHRPERWVRASDVLYNWHRLANPAWASPGSYLFDGLIEGWGAYRQGKASTISGLRAIGDSVVEVHLEKPYALFPYLLTLPYTYIALPESVEARGRGFSEHPVGTGPFAFQYEEKGRLVVFRRWEGYWGGFDSAGVPGIAFRWFGNRLWAYEALKRGEIDVLDGLDRNLAHILRSDSAWMRWAILLSEPALGTEYLGMDIRPASPLGDRALRQALAWAITQLPLTEVVYQGHATPARSFVPPSLGAGEPILPEPPDDTAWEKLRHTTLYLYSSPGFRELCEYIQSRLAREGITFRIEYLLGPSLRERLQKASLPLWKASWIADFPDAENFLILFEGDKVIPQGPNTTRFRDPVVDSLLHLARQTLDAEHRKALYAEIERRVLSEWPVIPLYHPHNVWLVRREVRGFPKSRLQVWLPLGRVRKGD